MKVREIGCIIGKEQLFLNIGGKISIFYYKDYDFHIRNLDD